MQIKFWEKVKQQMYMVLSHKFIIVLDLICHYYVGRKNSFVSLMIPSSTK